METREGRFRVTAFSALAALLVGCSSGSGDPAPGRLTLSVSDAPAHHAIEVCLEFDEVEIKRVGSPHELITELTLQQINLLDFQGPNSAPLFMDVEVDPGEYQSIRLGVNAVLNGNGGQGSPPENSVGCSYGGSYVLFENEPNTPYNAYVPSGAQTGLKINSNFTVAQGGTTRMTAEFDLQKTLTEPPGLDGNIIVRPSIKLVNDLLVGTVIGIVETETAEAEGCMPSVYAFDDGDDTRELDPADAVTSAVVSNEANPDVYEYAIGFLDAGEDGAGRAYDLAFTCDDGVNFDPGIGNVTIVAGGTEMVDFPIEQPAEQ